MNPDETRVFNYLKTTFGENVVIEPDGKVPPDILVNSAIAIEVRRLNKNFFDGANSEGLEQLSFPMFDVFNDVLMSFDSGYQGKTYWVSIRFERPLNLEMKQVKKDMKIALARFLDSGVSGFPCKLGVNEMIEFTIYYSQPVNGRIFRPANRSDRNADSRVITDYKENLRYCIIEKSSKVAPYLPKYSQWWLFLVDHMGWGLNAVETKDLTDSISDLGKFDGIFILSNNGDHLLASLTK